MEAGLGRICQQGMQAIQEGYSFLILSDRATGQSPPSPLNVAAKLAKLHSALQPNLMASWVWLYGKTLHSCGTQSA